MKLISSCRAFLLLLLILLLSLAGFAQVSIGVAVHFGPPAIPVYVQPACPAPGYMWVPGYWAWDPDFGDYYWVPGTWVLAPMPGYLWTPGYWAWNGTGFFFTAGYWGPVVGFYGGINYGFGYFGHGYEGGRWEHNQFYYNTAVNNVNVTNIHNTYNTVINNVTVNRVSYNGGPGGISARPTPQDVQAQNERHLPPVATQTQHMDTARANPQLRASYNQSKPLIAATDRPNSFKSDNVVAAEIAGAPYHTPTPVHAKDLPPHPRPTAPSGGNAEQTQKYQQQQQELYAKQEKEHQQLMEQQEAEHQKATQPHAGQQQTQEMELRHQQQTQQMEAHHYQQQQLRMHQAPPQQSHSGQKPAK